MSMNRMSNQQLVLGYHMTDGDAQDRYYREISRRIVTWGVLTGQRTHMPRQVIIDLFRRHMNQNDIIIPPDKIEGQYFDEDLFKI